MVFSDLFYLFNTVLNVVMEMPPDCQVEDRRIVCTLK